MNGMALYNFHRVLITAAFVFFLAFAVYAWQRYTAEGGTTNFVMAAASAAVGVGAIAYLIYFNIRLRKLSDQMYRQ